MNYFQFYNISVAFGIDQAQLRTLFLQQSKATHPDFFANENPKKQAEMLELSSLNNKAYNTLKDDKLRFEYILRLTNTVITDEKYSLEPMFLGEMMDINELLMDIELDASQDAIEGIKQEFEPIFKQNQEAISTNKQKYDAGNEAEKESILEILKKLYYEEKYLLRISEKIRTFAP